MSTWIGRGTGDRFMTRSREKKEKLKNMVTKTSKSIAGNGRQIGLALEDTVGEQRSLKSHNKAG